MKNNNPDWKKNLSPFERQPRPYTEDEFKEKYYSGMTITEIAEFFEIGRKKVQNDIKLFGVKSRKASIRNQVGKNNKNWKGDGAGYSAGHLRKTKLHGQPKKCEVCETDDPKKRYEWASMTGNYTDPDDYKRMCKSCHSKHDKKERNFKGKRCG